MTANSIRVWIGILAHQEFFFCLGEDCYIVDGHSSCCLGHPSSVNQHIIPMLYTSQDFVKTKAVMICLSLSLNVAMTGN